MEILPDIVTGTDFLEKTPEAQEIKAKIDKWDNINLLKRNTQQSRGNRQMGENISNSVTHKVLICRIYEKLKKLIDNKTCSLVTK